MRNLQEKTVILDVIFHRPGSHRSESGEKVDTKANKRWLSVTKKLFESKAYNEARLIQTNAGIWLKRRSVPCGLEGYFVLALSMVDEVIQHMDEQDALLKAKVEEFAVEYDKIVEEAKKELQDMFDPRRYPTANHYRRGIWMERRFVELGIPDPVKIGDALYEVEREKAKKRWADASEEVVYALREEFAKLIGHISEKLTPSPDGSKKVLKDAALDKVLEWIDLFSKRNVLDDKQLDVLVKRSKDVLNGVDLKSLRKDESAKDLLAKRMETVKVKLDAMLVNKPARLIRFDDEE